VVACVELTVKLTRSELGHTGRMFVVFAESQEVVGPFMTLSAHSSSPCSTIVSNAPRSDDALAFARLGRPCLLPCAEASLRWLQMVSVEHSLPRRRQCAALPTRDDPRGPQPHPHGRRSAARPEASSTLHLPPRSSSPPTGQRRRGEQAGAQGPCRGRAQREAFVSA
jgi:hypothetical protein